MSESSSHRAPAPGAASRTVLDAESPFQHYIGRYWKAAAMVAIALGAGLLVGRVLHSQRIQRDMAAWDEFQTIVQDPTTSFGPDHLPESLARAKERPLIYPWVVLAAVNHGFTRGDSAALQALQPELAAIEDAGSLRGLYLVSDGERVEVVPYLRQQVEKELQSQNPALQFQNPEPTGKRVKITVSSDGGDTYDIVIGLYEDVAPLAAQNFLSAVEAASLVDQDLSLLFNGLRVVGLAKAAEPSDPLPLEAQWGYFRKAGALATQVAPQGSGGQQDRDVAVILTKDDYSMDGQTTVFGQIVEGRESLDALSTLQSSADAGTVPPKLKVAAAVVLP
ncbi:MAG: hypothetical protein EYC70_09230 [Planctomycetota bacterium]|nr:MAG: hypothetical protein EYC70_09230 [Planctomycetota bacterium]